MKKYDILVVWIIAITVALAIPMLIKKPEPTKPERGVSFDEAKIYAAGFERGYRQAVLDSMGVAVDASDANENVGEAMMEDLIEKSKEIRKNSLK